MERLRISIAQKKTATGDIKGNTKKALEAIRQAKKENADIIVFPELFITGYMLGDLPEEEQFLKLNRMALEHIAKQTDGLAAYIGFIDYDRNRKGKDGRFAKYNAAAVIQDGKVVRTIRKTLLPTYRYFMEKRHFLSPENPRHGETGPEVTRLNIKGNDYRIGFMICEDMWDDDYSIKVVERLAAQDAELIINISQSPFGHRKNDKRHRIIREHIRKHPVPWIYVNGVGIGDNVKNIILFDGNSSVYDKEGDIIAQAGSFAEDFLTFDLGKGSGNKKLPDQEHDLEELHDALVFGIQEYVRQSGSGKVVIGLSGVIDSAVMAALCSEALGPQNVIAINMPTRFNSEQTKDAAKKLAENLEIDRYIIHPIQDTFDRIVSDFESATGEKLGSFHKENIQARIRGADMLQLYSAVFGGLVTNNSNKAEMFTGYCTFYGDMVGAFAAIADLTKGRVYELGRYINKEKEIIPAEIFEMPPSAELSEEQDIDKGKGDPFIYPVLDPLLEDMIGRRRNASQILMSYDRGELVEKYGYGADKGGKDVYDHFTREEFAEFLGKINKLCRDSRVKGAQFPPLFTLSARSRGFDLREAILDRFDDPMFDWYRNNGSAKVWQSERSHETVEKELEKRFAKDYFGSIR